MKKRNLSNLMLCMTSVALGVVSCDDSLKLLKTTGELGSYTYNVGDSLDVGDLKVFDRETEVEILDYDFLLEGKEIDRDYVFESVGTYSLAISKEGYKLYNLDDIVVSEISVGDILTIDTLPTKTTYNEGEKFDSSGLVIKAGNQIINDYSLSITDGTSLEVAGTYEVSVLKENYSTAYFNIEVEKVSRLVVQNKPTIEVYLRGDTFSSEGIKVIDYKTGDVVEDFSLSISEGTSMNTVGKTEISVTKDGYIGTSFEIETIESLPSTLSFGFYSINDTHGSFNRSDENSEAGMAYIGDYFLDTDSWSNFFFSVGDMWQGGAESNKTKGLIMTEAMNEMGIDAMAIGNHEFDWGAENIEKNLSIMEFPLLACNIYYANTSNLVDFVEPYHIFERAGIRIGLIGAVAEDLGSDITQSIARLYDYVNPLNDIIKWSNYLKNTEECDIILLATHDGGTVGYIDRLSDTYATLAEEGYVDAMFFAHDHARKASTYYNVPYVEAGSNGRYIGHIGLTLTSSSSGYNVSANTYRYYSAMENCDIENQEIASLLTKYSLMIGDLNEIIYYFRSSYSRDEFTSIVCDAITWFIKENYDYYGVDDIYMTVHNYGGVRSSVYSGAFTYADLLKVCPFDNPLTILTGNIRVVNNFIERSDSYCSNVYGEVPSDGIYTIATISYVAEQEFSWSSEDYIEYPLYMTYDAVYNYLKYAPNLNL